jgi:hypothetical protein
MYIATIVGSSSTRVRGSSVLLERDEVDLQAAGPVVPPRSGR